VIRGVLFDLDGTLIDTATAERGRWTAVRGLIEQRLPEVDIEDFERRYRDHTRTNRATSVDTGHFTYLDYQRQRLRTVLEPWAEPSDALIDEYARTSNEMMALVRPLPGAAELLAELRRRGLAIGLLTNGPSAHQRMKLDASGLAAAIDAIAVSAELGVAKPDVEAFRRAAEMIGYDISEVAMIGDTPDTDIVGALAAGAALTIWFRRRDEPQPDGARVITGLDGAIAALGLDRG
jgi:HAD superfamily hydrolase (TIGR01549 family)